MAAACGSDVAGPAGVASVQITPVGIQVEVGASTVLSATPRDANGNALNDRAVTWSSDSTAIATVSVTGMVTGVAPGTATIRATSEGVTGSASVTVRAGVPVRLAFTTPPTAATAGSPLTPAVQVAALDAAGFVATSFTGSVTIALGANPAGGTLSGTTTATASAGVTTFANLILDQVGGGYTFIASAASLTAATSGSFSVAAGPAAQLEFTAPPGDVVAGDPLTPAVVVTARDVAGNIATGFTGAVTLALGANPAGATLSGTTTVSAVAGVATFGDLHVDKAGGGYTLLAAATGPAGATSDPFDVLTGAAAQLRFTTDPGTTVAGAAITPAVSVGVFDTQGNPVSDYVGSVGIALDANPGAGTLSGTTVVSVVGGEATFPGLSIERAAAGYTLAASAPGLAGATSAAFSITGGLAAELVFTVEPGGAIAGETVVPPVEVAARDALGNVADGFTGSVSVALASNPGGAVLSGSTTVTATAGVASFADLALDKVGTGYTLRATAAGLPATTSTTFNVAGGPPSVLVFTVQPADGTAASPLSPAVEVTARDDQGNVATTFSGSITITIGTNPGGGTLSGTSTALASAGIAVFDDLRIDKIGIGYTLRAASAGLPTVTSNAFTVAAGPAAALAFTVQPNNAQAGAAITPAVRVTALDAGGNVATGFAGDVIMAIGTNPSGGALSGATTVTASAGVAAFATLSIDRSGAGYTLAASAVGLTTAASAPFNVTTGPLVQVAFSVQPSTTVAGAAIAPAVKVAAQDAFGNTVTTFQGSITVAIGTNPGSGTLSGTKTVGAVSGVATFANLGIDKAGTGYTLTASAAALPPATSVAFDILAGDAALAFTVQPTTTPAGAAIAPAVEITARDAFGNTVTSFTGSVTVTIGTNPAAGTLSGTTTVSATAGVATFSDLSIDKMAAGYTLAASSAGVPGATSGPFSITAGPATQLAFSVQPTGTTAGSAISPAVRVQARDAGGNLATDFTGTITVAIGTNAGGGTLSGTTAVAAVGGVATFSDLSVDKAAAGYTLIASATGLADGTSAAFSVSAGALAQVGFVVQPGAATAGVQMSPPIQVAGQDAFGNTVAGFTGNVTVAIGVNPGGGALSGTTTVGASSGVASFTNLSINKSGAGYTLTASAASLAGATSDPFTVSAGPPTQLVFSGQPGDVVAGSGFTPDVQITARDAQGNVATGFTGDVTVAIGTNPAGGTLSGAKTVAAVAGVAPFPTLSIDRAAPGYTLTAASGGLPQATSTSFAVLPGAAAELTFTVQPTSAVAGAAITPPVQVTARDALGNTATGFSGSITVALDENPGGGTLAGTKTLAAVNGVATFSTLSVDKVGAGYTLAASAAGLGGALSAPFSITPGPAARLAFTVQPTSTIVDAAIAPAVQVTARDAQGNVAPGFTGTVTIALGANPGGATLSGTLQVGAGAGIASFADLHIDQAGVGYTLVATASGLSADTSASFTVSPGASHLVFTVEPTTAVAGVAIAPAIKVAAQDPNGNTVTTFTGTVTIALAANPGGGTLSGTKVVAAVAGVATFASLSVDKVGAGYTLAASTPGLTGGTSAGFQITPGAPSAAQSSVTTATDTLGQCLVSCALGLDAARITVTVRDQFGNLVPGAAVTMSAAPGDSVRFTGAGDVGTTNGAGVFHTDVNVARAGTQTVSAIVGGASIAPGATIAVMPVLVGAGDIARCDLLSDDATANLLDSIPGVVYTLGDNAYPDGTTADFNNCYDTTWGRHKARTRPTSGNRDYNTASAAPYYAYFGAVANPSGGTGNEAGYYSFDLGGWHILSLNTETNTSTTSPQGTWLRQELSGRRNQCVLAMWHKPLFGSTGAPSGASEPLWQMVADSGAEVVLNGHGHIYERFAPMNASGNASPTGVREFIVGTGGTGLGGFGTDPPNSEVRDKTTHGVLRIVLYPNRYRWQFIPAPGFGSFTDTGTASCN